LADSMSSPVGFWEGISSGHSLLLGLPYGQCASSVHPDTTPTSVPLKVSLVILLPCLGVSTGPGNQT
jgi:hypothetical protein